MYVGSVVIDCNDFSRMLAFWQEALGYTPREPAETGWVVLCDPLGNHVNVSLQQVPERRIGKNRLHLDLYTNNQAAEVERSDRARRHETRSTGRAGGGFRQPQGPGGQHLRRHRQAGRVMGAAAHHV